MSRRIRLRRRPRRTAPAVRRAPAGPTAAAREAARTTREPAVTVGGTLDPAEHEADRLAAQALGPLRRACACGGAADPEPIRRSAAPAAVLAPGAASATAPPAAARAMAAMGAGRALSPVERGFFEPRLGADLGAVRVHADAGADRAAGALGARAFTRGTDVALARDGRDLGTLAHELAHVARGDTGVRRKIRITHDPSFRILTHLSDEYAVGKSVGCALTESKGLYECGSFKTSGPLDEQIVQNMVASERTFDLWGDRESDIELSLAAHVDARLGAIDLAKSIRVAFRAGTPKVSKAFRRLILDEVEKRLKAHEAALRAAGKTQDEVRAEMDRVDGPTLHQVFREQSGTVEFEAVINDIVARSEAHAKKAKKTASPAHDYAMACQLATMTVMYGGAKSAVSQQDIAGFGSDKVEPTRAVWTDWVPGDWGYIKNMGTSKPALGLEGENFIAIGDGKFWAHFDPAHPIQTLETLFAMVESWDGSAWLQTTRRYPAAGLK